MAPRWLDMPRRLNPFLPVARHFASGSGGERETVLLRVPAMAQLFSRGGDE